MNCYVLQWKQTNKSKVIELTDKNLEVYYEKIIISCRYVWMPKSL